LSPRASALKSVPKASNLQVLMALLKTFAIVAPFLVPGSFKRSGVGFGPFALVVAAGLVGVGGCLMIDCALHFRESDVVLLARKARGEWVSLLTEAALFLVQMSITVNFVMFFIAYVESIFEGNQVYWMTTVDLGFILCLLLAPLTWLRNLRILSSFLTFCALVIGIAILTVVVHALGTGVQKGFVKELPDFNRDAFLTTMGFSVYVFAGIG
jgi:hypothetical protein